MCVYAAYRPFSFFFIAVITRKRVQSGEIGLGRLIADNLRQLRVFAGPQCSHADPNAGHNFDPDAMQQLGSSPTLEAVMIETSPEAWLALFRSVSSNSRLRIVVVDSWGMRDMFRDLATGEWLELFMFGIN